VTVWQWLSDSDSVAVAGWQLKRDADRFLNGRNRSRMCFIVVFDAVGSKCGSGKVAVAVWQCGSGSGSGWVTVTKWQWLGGS
jgi:hypothetical protein